MRVRFLQDSRHGDWRKGDLGEITKTLAEPPQSQSAIHIVKLENGTSVWATDKDVEQFEQMTIFDL